MPLVIHTSFRQRLGRAKRRSSSTRKNRKASGGRRRILSSVLRAKRRTILARWKLASLLSPVFLTVFPTANILAENNVGWLPYFGEQIDKSTKRIIFGPSGRWVAKIETFTE